MKELKILLGTNILAVSMAYGQVSSAKSQIGVQLSPIPPYPERGVIPNDLENQYVFRDLKTGDLIFSYPSELQTGGAPAFAIEQGGRITQRVSLNNNTDPWFTVTVTKSNDKLLYTYSVRNGPKASDFIAEWHIGTRALPPQVTDRVYGSLGIPAALEAQTEEPARVDWSASDLKKVISPGASSPASSHVLSSLRPGFVLASVSGSAASTLDQLDVPPIVRTQFSRLKNFDIDHKNVLTIGPKFPVNTPDAAVTADFLVGIEMLVHHRYLSAQSPLVKELTEKLKAYTMQGGLSQSAPIEAFPHFAATITSKPATPLEQQIFSALLVSLDIH